jgi:hypothetical protein
MASFPEAIAKLIPSGDKTATTCGNKTVIADDNQSPTATFFPPHSRFGISCLITEPDLPRISKTMLVKHAGRYAEQIAKQNIVLAKIIGGELVAVCGKNRNGWKVAYLGEAGVCYYNEECCVNDEACSIAWPGDFVPVCVLPCGLIAGTIPNCDYVALCKISRQASCGTTPVIVKTNVHYKLNTIWDDSGAPISNLEFPIYLSSTWCNFTQLLIMQ